MNRLFLKSLFLATFPAIHLTSMAGTIEWNSPVHETNLDSSGAPLCAAYEFQLGVFSSGFEPTASNMVDWDSRWNVADTAGYNPNSNAYGSSYKLPDNAAPFTVGTPGWIMGTKVTPTGTEKILFRRSNWSWPSADQAGQPPALAKEWSVYSGSGNLEVIFAAVDPNGGQFLMQTAMVRSYDQWRELYLANEDLDGPNDDSEGDGIPNLLKFIFDSDAASSRGRVPFTALSEAEVAGERYLQIEIPRNRSHLAQLKVQVSSDLVNWFDGPAYTAVVADGPHSWIVRDKTPISDHSGKRFMRLKADLATQE